MRRGPPDLNGDSRHRPPERQANPVVLGSPGTKYRLVFGKVQTPLQDRTSGTVRESDGSDMGRSYLDAVAAEKD